MTINTLRIVTLVAVTLLATLPNPSVVFGQNAQVEVNFKQRRSIGGVSEFSRQQYINLHHFFYNVSGAELDVLLGDLEGDLGRIVGSLDWEMQFIDPDPLRAGFPRYDQMRSRGSQSISNDAANTTMQTYGDNDFIFTAHPKSIFPNRPRQAAMAGKTHFVPTTWEGALSFYTRMLDWYFGGEGTPTPRYLEVMNEPLVHAGEMETTQFELIRFHGAAADSFHAALPGSLVGGYASAWPEYERNNFGVWDETMKAFIDEVGSKMDFLSVHLYDFYPTNGPPHFRVGSNIEAILDLVRQYSQVALGEPLPLVISEYGSTGDRLAEPYTPARDFITLRAVNSILLQLMDRPDQVLKAIPFITARTDNATNPYPFAARRKLPDGTYEWTHLTKFFELWKGVKGDYVGVQSSDPDILVQAFLDGRNGYLAVNNLLETPQEVTLSFADFGPAAFSLVTERRLALQNEVPELSVNQYAEAPAALMLGGFETVVYHVQFTDAPEFESQISTMHQYADSYRHRIVANQPIQVTLSGVPVSSPSQTGTLRLGLARSHALPLLPTRVSFNGTELELPDDWSGSDQASRDQFWGVVEIAVPAGRIAATNTVEIVYASSSGTVSSVVLELQTTSDVGSTRREDVTVVTDAGPELFPNPVGSWLSMRWPGLREPARVSVYDVLGRRVLAVDSMESGDQIDLSGLPQGTYAVQILAQGASHFRLVTR